MNKTFELYDLKIEVHQQNNKPMVCNHPKGSYFILSGENLIFPEDVTFPIYSLAALMPILPAKQRETEHYDWMSTDHYIACPDPNCGGLFKIVRLKEKRKFFHHEVSKVKLIDNEFKEIINGCWQLAAGHSESPHDNINELLMKYVSSGLNSFDCADIYTGVEECLGLFKKIAKDNGHGITIHTKYVPNLNQLATLNEKQIINSIQKSCIRLGVDSLDLVQFHWWDFNCGNYIQTLQILQKIKSDGMINKLGLTNFDVANLKRVVEAGIEISSIQIQYSLIDHRAEKSLMTFAKNNNIKILAYGILCGGFLSEKWLGQPEPMKLSNRSLTKYKLIINEFGGWSKFQKVLFMVNNLANSYNMNMVEFITLYMLRYTDVDSIILGISRNFKQNPLALLNDFRLHPDEIAQLKACCESAISGEVYGLERDLSSQHAKIMHYNLNMQN